jgi:glycosyltransferase involved in cell wall biosynthesis
MISIIIPSYNRRDLLEQTLDSVRRNPLVDTEILVVDDGSTDGTLDYLKAQTDLRWFQQANSGPSAARNLGASEAKGNYLAFLDSDDLWFPWTLDTYASVIGESSAAFIAGKPFRFSDLEETKAVKARPLQTNTFPDYLASGDEWRWWGCSSFVIRRDAFEAAKGFTGKRINAEDADMALRLGTACKFVQITSPATFAYREHEVSEMKNAALNLKGIEHVLQTQLAGGYPGGPGRRSEQWRIVSRHMRPAALASLQGDKRSLAWRIYRATLPYHLKTRRWKFVLGFLVKALS